MTTVIVSMMRDEADVVEGWVRHHADEVDHLIVADNGSTDGTRDILRSLAKQLPLTIVDDPVVGYYQSAKLSALAERAAREFAATWVLPADADELWLSRKGQIGAVLDSLPEWQTVVRAPLTNHFATALDPAGDDPFRTMVWRQRDPQQLPKVAFRWQPGAVVEQGNHGVQLPFPGETVPGEGLLELRHFPVRSPEHMVRTARNGAEAYRAAPDLDPGWGGHWRAWGDLIDARGEDAIRDAFRLHWWYLSPVDAGLVRDPAPYLRWRTPEPE